MVGYRLLVTGRLLLACLLSARSAGDHSQVDDATRVLHATSVVLHHVVARFPVALGSAEVLDETIRVCRVPPAHDGRESHHGGKRYAWYRPIVHSKGFRTSVRRRFDEASSLTQHGRSDHHSMITEGDGGDSAVPTPTSAVPPVEELPPDSLSPFSLFDADFGAGNVFMPAPASALGHAANSVDFAWLLPGGPANLPYLFPTP